MTRHAMFKVGADRISFKPIADLKAYDRNARTHSRKQIRQIAESIERFGFTNPVLIDEDGMILAGHGRVEAAKRLNWREVPCLLIGSLSEGEKRAYIIADNRLAEKAGWDDTILAGELEYLIEDCPDIDVRATGFSISEIDILIEPGGTDPATESEEDDALPAPEPNRAPVTQTGDIWQLGDHLLVCGDALEKSTYQALMDAPAQMVFADPPYNVPIDGHVLSKGQHKHREFAMASGEMTSKEFTRFLQKSFRHLADHSTDGAIHFICMDWRHVTELLEAGSKIYGAPKNLCVWVKDNGGMGSFYRSRHELVFVFRNGDAPHINSFELGQHGRYRTNVWNYRGITSGTRTARAELAMHPTVKPVAMVADAIRDCSAPGGIVLDAFGGAGTTLIASEKTRRRARLIEIDPVYCDTIIRRWQDYTHEDAVLRSSGETFEDVLMAEAGSHDE